jgi:hypothetical protein
VGVSCRMARVSMLSSPQTEGNAACLFDGGPDRTYFDAEHALPLLPRDRALRSSKDIRDAGCSPGLVFNPATPLTFTINISQLVVRVRIDLCPVSRLNSSSSIDQLCKSLIRTTRLTAASRVHT